MKWFFFILLLANLGMFILIYPQKAEKKVDNSLPDVGELYLYEELMELRSDGSITDEISPAGSEKTQAGSGHKAVDDQTVSNLSNEEPVFKGYNEEAVIPPESERQPPVDDSNVADEPAVAAAPVCRTIGYLESRSDAEIVSVRLRALGLKPELQSETSNEAAGIWVLIPPQDSRREAIEISNRLERDGVSDLWRFTSGELVHAISLGLFRNIERAEARQKEITALGYDVIIKPRFRQNTKYWIYFQEATPNFESQGGWNDLLAKFPGLELNETACR